MKGWDHDRIVEAAEDLDAPHAKRAVANQLLNAESTSLDKSLKPIADAAFERLANRTEFVPKAGSDINVQAVLVNVGVDQLLDRINGFLQGQPSDTQRTFDVAESVASSGRQGQGPPAQLPATERD
jgi:hypothetical protein